MLHIPYLTTYAGGGFQKCPRFRRILDDKN